MSDLNIPESLDPEVNLVRRFIENSERLKHHGERYDHYYQIVEPLGLEIAQRFPGLAVRLGNHCVVVKSEGLPEVKDLVDLHESLPPESHSRLTILAGGIRDDLPWDDGSI